MKIKTAEVSNPALAWAVAMCEGYDEGWLRRQLTNPIMATRAIPDFATDWAEAGVIMTREGLHFREETKGHFLGFIWNGVAHVQMGEGPTPIIAAMRAYVASKLGDEIDVPAELMAASAKAAIEAIQESQAPSPVAKWSRFDPA
jgi:hypothetical protein